MSDITIHRCTLRIVRHGGWGWGPEPRKLLDAAINALPELLAGELTKLWPNDVELEYATPISFRVPLSMQELLVATGAGGQLDLPQTTSVTEALTERIGVAARKALVCELNALETPASQEMSLLAEQENSLLLTASSGNKVLEVLFSWRRGDVLERRLVAFSLPALKAWLDHVVQHAGAAGYRDSYEVEDLGTTGSEVNDTTTSASSWPFVSETIEQLVFESTRKLPTTLKSREAVIRRRLIVLVDVMLQRGMRKCSPELAAAVYRALPLDQTEEEPTGGLQPTAAAKQARFPEAFDYLEPAPLIDQASPRPSQSGGRLARLDGTHKDAESESDSTSSELVERRLEVPGSATFQTVIQSDASSVVPFRKVESRFAWPIQQSESTATPTGAENDSLVLRPRPTTQSFELARDTTGQMKSRHVASTLPFLLLGPLSRMGYLKVLDATLEAANAASAAAFFAAALAYKVLAPPERSWRRQPQSIAAAKAFAGLNERADEPALVDLALHFSSHLSPLEAALSGALISGHNQQQPLFLMRTEAKVDGGFLLVDVEGTFPIQWAASLSDLRHTLIQLDSAIVLVPQTSADPTLLRWLDEEGFRFVTDAIPTRGEGWRALRRSPPERWWTNDAISSDPVLVKAGQRIFEAADEAATLWEALAVQRPSIPLARDKRLDRHLTLAAAVALGTIAWELWRSRESPSPCLALERFRDLEARVSYVRDVVQVSLPLGKRFYDLRDHGLLDDVADVPWFNGRTLRFSSN